MATRAVVPTKLTLTVDMTIRINGTKYVLDEHAVEMLKMWLNRLTKYPEDWFRIADLEIVSGLLVPATGGVETLSAATILRALGVKVEKYNSTPVLRERKLSIRIRDFSKD